ncbi:MAG: MazG family protein [Bacteroidetes bacterium]|nr:MazG family protein [Bacteroidota bacterium]
MKKKQSIESLFAEYIEVVRKLRKECPWDREQTHQSIRHSLIEEAYEVVEAIDHKDLDDLKLELGDLLLHVVLHSIIAEEESAFTIENVV